MPHTSKVLFTYSAEHFCLMFFTPLFSPSQRPGFLSSHGLKIKLTSAGLGLHTSHLKLTCECSGKRLKSGLRETFGRSCTITCRSSDSLPTLLFTSSLYTPPSCRVTSNTFRIVWLYLDSMPYFLPSWYSLLPCGPYQLNVTFSGAKTFTTIFISFVFPACMTIESLESDSKLMPTSPSPMIVTVLVSLFVLLYWSVTTHV